MGNISHTHTTNSLYPGECVVREKMLILPFVLLLYLFQSPDASAQRAKAGTITVAPAILSFVYKDAPGQQVTEFTAIVTERTKWKGSKHEQKCSESLKYEAGNYHIEINTFPKTIRNMDIDFGEEYVITIQQPGFVKFSSDRSAHDVTLFQKVGDNFFAFYTLGLNDPRSQNLMIQPGKYEAHYRKGAGQNSAEEQVKRFVVKPTKITEVKLN